MQFCAEICSDYEIEEVVLNFCDAAAAAHPCMPINSSSDERPLRGCLFRVLTRTKCFLSIFWINYYLADRASSALSWHASRFAFWSTRVAPDHSTSSVVVVTDVRRRGYFCMPIALAHHWTDPSPARLWGWTRRRYIAGWGWFSKIHWSGEFLAFTSLAFSHLHRRPELVGKFKVAFPLLWFRHQISEHLCYSKQRFLSLCPLLFRQLLVRAGITLSWKINKAILDCCSTHHHTIFSGNWRYCTAFCILTRTNISTIKCWRCSSGWVFQTTYPQPRKALPI